MTGSKGQIYVVASTFGVTLVFPSKRDLVRVIGHLQNMLESVDSDPPHLYHIADARIPFDASDEWTDWIKYVFGRGIEDE